LSASCSNAIGRNGGADRGEDRDQVTDLPAHAARPDGAACQACGACCSYSPEWPRFSLEEEAALDLIPSALVDDNQGRMRCDNDRCLALVGEVGVSTACSIFAVRPHVCRACLPGDDACQMARRRFGLAPSEPATAADSRAFSSDPDRLQR
jgi:Fe-S-cluster containining protein